MDKEYKQYVNENRNEIKACPCCNGNIQDRKVTIYKGLINALGKVYVWCINNKVHEFTTKDIRHLLGKNEYARFGDLVRFGGGIVYRPDSDEGSKAHYGINMERAAEFFRGKRSIPKEVIINQITKEVVSEVRGYVGEFAELRGLLDYRGLYISHEI